jgi:Uma2 family endonuclease
MSARVLSYISPVEYLRLERQSEYKSEYLNGEIFAMTGASRKHNLIGINSSSSLHQQLKGRHCEVYGGEMRVKVRSSGLYTYPDVVVVCGEPEFEDDEFDTLLNPTVLIEILSPSTERYDRIAKTSYYRTIESLAEHLLLAQDEIRVEQYVRQADGRWLLFEYSSLESVVELRSIGCSLALRDVYHKIEIENKPRIKTR